MQSFTKSDRSTWKTSLTECLYYEYNIHTYLVHAMENRKRKKGRIFDWASSAIHILGTYECINTRYNRGVKRLKLYAFCVLSFGKCHYHVVVGRQRILLSRIANVVYNYRNYLKVVWLWDWMEEEGVYLKFKNLCRNKKVPIGFALLQLSFVTVI